MYKLDCRHNGAPLLFFSDAAVKTCSCEQINERIEQQNRENQDQVNGTRERVQSHFIKVIQRRRQDESLRAQQ